MSRRNPNICFLINPMQRAIHFPHLSSHSRVSISQFLYCVETHFCHGIDVSIKRNETKRNEANCNARASF